MKTAEEKISGDSGAIDGTRLDPMPWNMWDECEPFPRFDLSSEGLDRECEMAHRCVMAHVDILIVEKTGLSFFTSGKQKSFLGGKEATITFLKELAGLITPPSPPAPYLG